MKDATNNPILPAAKPSGPVRPLRPGFTLIELLVVISIIALSVSIVLPSMIGLFTAGGERQARTLLGTMCGAARGLAIENQTYTAVWMQIDQNQAHPRCWVAVLELDKDVLDGDNRPRTFIPSKIAPRQVPGDMAYGQMLSSGGLNLTGFQSICVLGGNEVYGDVAFPRNPATRANAQQVFLQVLTQAVLVFGPDGQLTNQVYGTDGTHATYPPKFGNKYALIQNAGVTRLDFANSRLLWANAGRPAAIEIANGTNPGGSPFNYALSTAVTPVTQAEDFEIGKVSMLTDPYGWDDGVVDQCDKWPPHDPKNNNAPHRSWCDCRVVSGGHNVYMLKPLPPVVSAVTVFNYATVAAMAGGPYTLDGSRSKYLTDGKTYVVVNPYTGQLLPNE